MKYKNIVEEKHKGTLAFVCPKCHQINYIKLKISAKIFDPDSSISIRITNRCNECCDDFTTELHEALDPEIASFIVALNEKGYKTHFSCQGHLRKKQEYQDSLPYIYFEGFLAEEDLNKLPATWRVDPIEAWMTGTIIRSDLSKHSMKEIQEDLGLWIDNLPDKSN